VDDLGDLLVTILSVAFFILAISAYFKSAANERALADLNRLVLDLRARLQKLDAEGELDAIFEGAGQTPPPQETVLQQADSAEETQVSEGIRAAFAFSESPPDVGRARVSLGRATTPAKGLEDALASRWLIWVGAVAIALAGTFFVKYAIDQGLLGPAARVTLGFIFGIALALAGEWLRRRPLQRALASVRPNHVPPALTASGLFVSFASIYAAYATYNLLAPPVAFIALALVALTGVALSLLQGRFVALLGLLAGFITPALVSTPNPSAWALFAYLIVMEAACLAVSRFQQWWWLGFVTLAGAVSWPLIWIAGPWHAGDALPIGGYVLLTALIFLLSRLGLERPPSRGGWMDELAASGLPERLVWAAGCLAAFVLFVVIRAANYDTTALVILALLLALYLVAGRRESALDGLSVVGAILALAVLATMPLPIAVAQPAQFMHAPLVPRRTGLFHRRLARLFGHVRAGGFCRPVGRTTAWNVGRCVGRYASAHSRHCVLAHRRFRRRPEMVAGRGLPCRIEPLRSREGRALSIRARLRGHAGSLRCSGCRLCEPRGGVEPEAGVADGRIVAATSGAGLDRNAYPHASHSDTRCGHRLHCARAARVQLQRALLSGCRRQPRKLDHVRLWHSGRRVLRRRASVPEVAG
jgi:uncharacterized membrane protein